MDVGSSSSLLPWRLSMLGYKVLAVDMRPYPLGHRNLTFLLADITNPEFWYDNPPFDVITCVSSLEHIGVGHYGDTMIGKGDQKAVATFNRVLKPGGSLLLTVPFSGLFSQDDFQRIYNPETISKLFSTGWCLREERYYIPKARKNWVLATQAEALKPYAVYPDSNNACFWFEKI
jgi:SAM-dependent methyltransferase